MRSVLIIIVTLVLTNLTQSQTIVGGNLTSDATWTKSGNPFLVTSTLSVYPNVTLTIDSGVHIKLDSAVNILIGGTLVARGSSIDSIRIDAQESAEANRWGVIKFLDSSTDAVTSDSSYLSGCIIEYTAIGGAGLAAIHVESASPLIRNNRIYDCKETLQNSSDRAAGIAVFNSPAIIIQNNTIENCTAPTAGVSVNGGFASIIGNIVRNNSGVAIAAFSFNRITIFDNLITNNRPSSSVGAAAIELGSSGLCLVKRNRIIGNESSFGGSGVDIFLGVNALVEENLFISNRSNGSPGDAHGTAVISIWGNSSTIRSNLFQNNEIPNSGIIHINDRLGPSNPSITYNTFLANSSLAFIYLGAVPYPRSIVAQKNYWNTVDSNFVSLEIHDFFDDLQLGIVDWRPHLRHGLPFPIESVQLRDSASQSELSNLNHLQPFQILATVSSLRIPENDTLLLRAKTKKDPFGLSVTLVRSPNSDEYGSSFLKASDQTDQQLGLIAAFSLDTIEIINIATSELLKKSPITQSSTIVFDYDESSPTLFQLHQNYPNPFNPNTTIEFTLPHSTNVKLTVANILGSQVFVLIDKYLNAGSYKVHWSPRDIASGLYLYRLEASGFQRTRRALYLK